MKDLKRKLSLSFWCVGFKDTIKKKKNYTEMYYVIMTKATFL